MELYTKKQMDKRHFYKTAKVKDIVRCYVGILAWNKEHDIYKCHTPYNTVRYYHADELENFGL